MAETFPRWGLPAVDFVDTDAEQIKTEILTAFESISGRTLSTGDPVRLFLLSLAEIIIQQRVCINTAAQQNLLTYAQGAYLDALGVFLSVTRLEATGAITTIRFKLSHALASAYTVPKGFEVTNGIVSFATDDELTIPPGELYGEMTATCTVFGDAGNNYLAGQISTIVTPMAFLESATNITNTQGGADAETDEEYAERIRLAPNSFSVAGPEKAYIYHAYSVDSSIIDVTVMSPTPGVVNVYPLIEGGELPSQELLDKVAAYLSSDTIRPLTDEVHVLSPTPVEYEIHLDYWIDESNKNKSIAIQEAVAVAVEKFRLWQQSKIGRGISSAQLMHDIIAAGASRVDVETQKPLGYTDLTKNEVAQCTSINLHYKGYKDE